MDCGTVLREFLAGQWESSEHERALSPLSCRNGPAPVPPLPSVVAESRPGSMPTARM